ncbi:MAG: sigma-70 family RNA polymerase sigma factor [Verrucomicrobiota bacterium]|jgi:RNA polymerase sigma factor (sigma-70 family)
MTEHRKLLAEYATNGSEEAFRELVACYINLVYSTAVRLADGDTYRAEDITQTVFTDLARLAGTLSPAVMLGGWLHRRTCHVAATVMRSERRRQKRERLAAEMNALYENVEAAFEQMAPLLDEAIDRLSARDRTAIVLRFFEHRDLRAIGEALGINADAAQKCVSRAVDKLRAHFVRHGIVVSSALIASTVAANAVQAAPAGLASGVLAKSLAAASGAGASGLMSFIKLFLAHKTLSTVSAIVVIGAAVSIPVINSSRSVTVESLRKGLMLHYTFDRAEPDGKVTDTSGQGNHGLAKGVHWTADGKKGGAYEFTADGDQIDVPNSDSLNPREITLAAWVKTTKQDMEWRRIFDKSFNGGYAMSIAGDFGQNSWRGQASSEIGPQPYFAVSDRVIADGQWHHLASTYDGKELRLYVDGQLQQDTVSWTGAVPSNQFGLTIGCNGSYPPQQLGLSFIGTMDEPMIWDRALSPKEISFLYESQP